MTIKDHQDGKMIILSKAFDTRAKFLNIFYFLLFTSLGIRLAQMMILSGGSPTILLVVLLVAIIGVYLFAAYKFINKAVQTEILTVDKNNFTIIKKGFLAQQKNVYDNALIQNFRHLEIKETFKHALAGETFDYLGFQTQQVAINQMHGDNRLAFDYNGKEITFGENVYTWDFEKLEIVLFDITEKDFRYTQSFEQSFIIADENEEEDKI